MTQQNPTNAGSAPSHADAVRLKRTLGLWSLVIIRHGDGSAHRADGNLRRHSATNGHGHVGNHGSDRHGRHAVYGGQLWRMARVYPSAGSAYTYVGQEMHSALGYIVGLGHGDD